MESKEDKIREYGALMLNFGITSNFRNILESNIESIDILDGWGIEDDPHTTVLFGFTKEVSNNDIKEVMLDKTITHEDIKIREFSSFNNEERDVLILKLDSDKLREYNNFFEENFPFTSDHSFDPHITIAYLKKGTSIKYINNQGLFNELFNELSTSVLTYKFDSANINENSINFSILCE